MLSKRRAKQAYDVPTNPLWVDGVLALIPIIIATARPNQLFTAVNAGVGALLEKPMDIPMLLRTIRKLLAESTEQRLGRLAGKETEFHYKPAT